MLYLLAVVLVAAFWGRGPSILAALISVISFDFFFVPPHLTLSVSDTQYLITFLGLFGVGLAISHLESRAREQAKAAQRRETQTASLYEFSRILAQSGTLEEITSAIVTHLSENFRRQVVVLLPQEGKLVIRARNPNVPAPDEDELAIATWVLERGQPAGRDTDTLSATTVRYVPLKTPRSVVGVLGIQPPAGSGHLIPEERHLMETFATQAALAIERAELAEQARQAQVAQTTERLQAALLGSISHDLRTPLVTITGVLSALKDDEAGLDEASRTSLIETAEEEADRLNRLVGNLLDMTRLEAGTLRPHMEPCDVADVIGSALEQLSSRLRGRQVITHVPQNLPLVAMDFVLMQQVLVNLLDNALKYSAPDGPVEVSARVVGEEMEIEVADRGIGIPPDELTRVFDKMYRVQRPHAVSGSGLGLTICKGIVEAHGGRIWAMNRPGGGTLLTVALTIGDADKEPS
jgi:two-component system sensor histidine kinase KdpD